VTYNILFSAAFGNYNREYGILKHLLVYIRKSVIPIDFWVISVYFQDAVV